MARSGREILVLRAATAVLGDEGAGASVLECAAVAGLEGKWIARVFYSLSTDLWSSGAMWWTSDVAWSWSREVAIWSQVRTIGRGGWLPIVAVVRRGVAAVRCGEANAEAEVWGCWARYGGHL